MAKGGAGTLALNVETFLHRKLVAHLDGTRSGDIANFYHTDFPEEVSKSTGLRALGVLFPCLEIVLGKVGIKNISGRTHPEFAKFLKQMSWKVIGRAGTATDVEKDIAKIEPKFVFRVRPRPKNSKKQTTRKTKLRHPKG